MLSYTSKLAHLLAAGMQQDWHVGAAAASGVYVWYPQLSYMLQLYCTLSWIPSTAHLCWLCCCCCCFQVYSAADITFRGTDYPRTLHLQDYSVEFPRHYNGGYSLVRQLSAIALNDITMLQLC
jgi:hypothetical protein